MSDAACPLCGATDNGSLIELRMTVTDGKGNFTDITTSACEDGCYDKITGGAPGEWSLGYEVDI